MTSTARHLSADFEPRLYDPGQHQDTPPPPTPWNPRWSVGRYYEECYLPRALAEEGRHPGTIEKDRQAIQEFGWTVGPVPLGDFGGEHWVAFLGGLKEITFRGRARAQNTRRGIATHLRHILSEASCEEWRDAEGQRHVGLVQLGRLKVPPLERRDPDDCYTVDEVGEAIACCEAEDFASDHLPPGLSPRKFWPALIRFAWNTALRPKSIFLAQRVWVGVQTPAWLRLPKEALKHASRPCEFYLNRWAREALDAAASDDPRLFAWRGWPTTKPQMFREHKRILLAAGLSEARAGFQFKGYRRAVLNWVLSQCSDTGDATAARLIAGHHFKGSLDYYAQRSKIIPPFLDRLPQPARQLPLSG